MHMADALVSPAVGTALLCVSAATVGYAVRQVKQNFDERIVPLMAIMGAFVFAAQMVNIVIPGTGSSGHMSGGILLAALIGPYAAFLAMSCVLILQAVIFADGGLLALGCNIFNLAFVSCFVAFPLFFRPMLKNGHTRPKLFLASILACLIAAQLGALGVVLQTMASKITELPFGTFVLFMQPIHFAIGLMEGVLTALVLLVVWQMEPDLFNIRRHRVTSRALVVFLCALTLVTGSGLSIVASDRPDGLEWSILKTSGETELERESRLHELTGSVQEKTAVMPDYTLPALENEQLGTGLAGLVGSLVTVFALFLLGLVLKRRSHRDPVSQG